MKYNTISPEWEKKKIDMGDKLILKGERYFDSYKPNKFKKSV